jgi:hypothetical protein
MTAKLDKATLLWVARKLDSKGTDALRRAIAANGRDDVTTWSITAGVLHGVVDMLRREAKRIDKPKRKAKR